MLKEKGYRYIGHGAGCERLYEKNGIEVKLNRCNGIVRAFKNGNEIAKRYFMPHTFQQEINNFINEIEDAS